MGQLIGVPLLVQIESECYSDVLERVDLGRHVFSTLAIPKYRTSTDGEGCWVIRFYLVKPRGDVDAQSTKGQICLLDVDCNSECLNRLLSVVLRELENV